MLGLSVYFGFICTTVDTCQMIHNLGKYCRPRRVLMCFAFVVVVMAVAVVAYVAQDMFSIKEGKANSITQKIMMDLMMKMMSDVS